MVTVTNFKTVETKDGRSFISLELTSGLEVVLMHTFGYKPSPSAEVVSLDKRELIEA